MYILNYLTEKFNNEVGRIVPSNDHILKGKFIGTWNDNIYTDFGISAELNFTGGRVNGSFYYSSTFSSCCMGATDGSINFKLNGNQIEEFVYNQQLEQFMGGECPGLYEGSGTISNYTTLIIDFEGNDCEGPHTGGKISLSKIP